MKPTEPNFQDSINISKYGYEIKSYRFTGEDCFEVYKDRIKISGVFETHFGAEKWCRDEISMNTDYLINS